MPHNILLVLGAGGRIGAALASTFTAKGYKVALASRSTTTGLDDNGIFKVQADLANPAGVEATFQTVAKQFGAWPSVVVYNGKCHCHTRRTIWCFNLKLTVLNLSCCPHYKP